MTLRLFNFLTKKPEDGNDLRLNALKDFSLAAPFALDPEKLSEAIDLLERFKWNAKNAARHVNNTHLRDFDDAMQEKGDDPLEIDRPPGPSH